MAAIDAHVAALRQSPKKDAVLKLPKSDVLQAIKGAKSVSAQAWVIAALSLAFEVVKKPAAPAGACEACIGGIHAATDGLVLPGVNMDEVRQQFQHAYAGLAAAKDVTAAEKLFASTLGFVTKKCSNHDTLRGQPDC